MFRKVKKVHFVGIGGIGMSGIAELLLNLEFSVSGSDITDSEIIQSLRKKGARIKMGHRAENINNCEVLVYSSAVKETNPELIAARNRGVPIIKRAQMLGELIALKETSIAIGGTHGKTSTSSMIGTVLSQAGLDPTMVVGGLVRNIATNSRLGASELIVVEADEFDRSFLALRPTIAIITNIELEHTDCYQDLEDLYRAFAQFANSAPFYGAVIACLDSPGVQKIIQDIQRPVITYGLSSQADFSAREIVCQETTTQFTYLQKHSPVGTVTLQVPGHHNVVNSLAAIALGTEMGLDPGSILKGLKAYRGVRRRFEIKGLTREIMVVDDYAHHPTEVKATLAAAKAGWNRRIVAVFQPHLYTRTRDFYKAFAEAFMNSEVLVVTDVYPAREEPIEGVTGELVANAARESGHKEVYYIEQLEELTPLLDEITQPNDMVITLGAGTIWRYGQAYFDHLQAKEDEN
ncbi:MAG: UDP-N-acetylmuramate--L-alanine ligase [Fidelibacterota bacterium]